jgi:hypothetical protein
VLSMSLSSPTIKGPCVLFRWLALRLGLALLSAVCRKTNLPAPSAVHSLRRAIGIVRFLTDASTGRCSWLFPNRQDSFSYFSPACIVQQHRLVWVYWHQLCISTETMHLALKELCEAMCFLCHARTVCCCIASPFLLLELLLQGSFVHLSAKYLSHGIALIGLGGGAPDFQTLLLSVP